MKTAGHLSEAPPPNPPHRRNREVSRSSMGGSWGEGRQQECQLWSFGSCGVAFVCVGLAFATLAHRLRQDIFVSATLTSPLVLLEDVAGPVLASAWRYPCSPGCSPSRCNSSTGRRSSRCRRPVRLVGKGSGKRIKRGGGWGGHNTEQLAGCGRRARLATTYHDGDGAVDREEAVSWGGGYVNGRPFPSRHPASPNALDDVVSTAAAHAQRLLL